MKTIQIGNRTIGEGFPTYIIAEVSINHNGDFDTARRLIDVAAEAKVNCVKFQMRDLPSLYPKDVLDNPWKYEHGFQYLIPILKETELPLFDHIRLKKHAEDLGLEYLCTPFDINSVDRLAGMGVRAYKIASCDLTNFELINKIAITGKPMIISTGMSTWDEIKDTVNLLKYPIPYPFALLHCRSAYPVWPREVNLKMITKLKEFGVPVGYSGHDIGTTIPLIAASMGAQIIEKHITLDQKGKGPDHKISLLPDELKVLVRDIRIADQAMQDTDRFLLRGEILNRDVFRYKGKKERLVGGPILEKEPIGKWGLITRPHDMEIIDRYNPKVVEFHLTESDLETAPLFKKHDAQLVVHVPEYIGDKIGDLCSGSDEIRDASIGIAQDTINWALVMASRFAGIPKVIVHPGAMSLNIRLKSSVMANNLMRSLDNINNNGVELLLENLPPYPVYFGGYWKGNYFMDAEEIKEFSNETGYNICFDLSHAALYCDSCEKDLSGHILLLNPYIRHLHIADGFGLDGEGCQIGEGDIDWERIAPMLDFENTSYVPEVWQGHQNGGAGFIEALNKIRELYEKTLDGV